MIIGRENRAWEQGVSMEDVEEALRKYKEAIKDMPSMDFEEYRNYCAAQDTKQSFKKVINFIYEGILNSGRII